MTIPPVEAPVSDTRYVFDNAHAKTRERFPALSDLYDAETIRCLRALGVGPGWQCLEVAAGGGSVARWLADAVGADAGAVAGEGGGGRVVATDLDTRFLDAMAGPALEVLRHDLAREALPRARFDLVHARLVLVHLPERERALAEMAAAVKPGGWLVCEEFDSLSMPADPVRHPHERALKAWAALQAVMAARGADTRYGRDLAARMDALGLVEVRAEARLSLWRGGSTGARLQRANVEQLRDALLATGSITPAELDADLARLDDPGVAFPSPVMWTVIGRRLSEPSSTPNPRNTGEIDPS